MSETPSFEELHNPEQSLEKATYEALVQKLLIDGEQTMGDQIAIRRNILGFGNVKLDNFLTCMREDANYDPIDRKSLEIAQRPILTVDSERGSYTFIYARDRVGIFANSEYDDIFAKTKTNDVVVVDASRKNAWGPADVANNQYLKQLIGVVLDS